MTTQIDPATTTALLPEVYARQQMLELIEDAMREVPFCECGAPMTVDADGDTLWLECPTFTEPNSGRLAWLRSGIRTALHQRSVLVRGVAIAA